MLGDRTIDKRSPSLEWEEEGEVSDGADGNSGPDGPR